MHYYIFQTKFAHVEGLCKRIPLKETLRSLKGNAQNEITTCWKESRNLLKESHVVRKIEVHQEVQKTLFHSPRQFLTRFATNSRKTRKLRNTVSKYRSVLVKYGLSTNYVLVYKINTPGFQSQTEGSFFVQVWPQEFCWVLVLKAFDVYSI